MKIIRLLILGASLILFSCKNQSNKEKKGLIKRAMLSSDLSTNLYREIVRYQREFPLPKNPKFGLYFYYLVFSKLKSDTIFAITRPGDGLFHSDVNSVLGVYKDSILAPTIIKDGMFLGRDLITKAIVDTNELMKFVQKPGHDYPESFPPIYMYKIHGKELVLEKVDTIWSQWDGFEGN
jgi:hypothetical protein